MFLNSLDNCFKSTSVESLPRQEKHIENNKKNGSSSENKALGYSPLPEDSFKSGSGKEDKRNFIEKAVDGTVGFIQKGLVKPAVKAFKAFRSSFTAQAVTAGTIIGGVSGAVIGSEAAKIEASNSMSSVQNWQEPVTYSKNLGNIPSSHFQYTLGLPFWSDTNRFQYDNNGKLVSASHGMTSVNRTAPVLNSDGSAQMRDVQKVVDSKRFGNFGGITGGIVLGSIGGFMGGLAVSLIHKLMSNN